MATIVKPRPYWYLDIKWSLGILTTILLTFSLLLSVFTILTSEKIAIPLATIIVASQFSRNGLDEPAEIDAVRKKFYSSGEDIFYPLGDKKVSITKSDLDTLTPREIRLKIFRQVVEPFYFERVDEKTKQKAGLLAFLNQNTHKIINQLFLLSIPVLFFSLGGLIFFSFGYGRLISPAVVFLLVSTLPAALLTLFAYAQPARGPVDPTTFPQEILQQVAKTIVFPYQLVFVMGLGLLLLAFVIKLLRRFIKQ